MPKKDQAALDEELQALGGEAYLKAIRARYKLKSHEREYPSAGHLAVVKLASRLLAYRKHGGAVIMKTPLVEQLNAIAMLRDQVTAQFRGRAAGLARLLAMAGSKIARISTQLGDNHPVRFHTPEKPYHSPPPVAPNSKEAPLNTAPRCALGMQDEWRNPFTYTREPVVLDAST